MLSALAVPSAISTSLSTDDFDEFVSFVAPFDPPLARVVHGRGLLGYSGVVRGGAGEGVSWRRFGLPLTLRGRATAPTLQIVVAGGARVVVGRAVVEAGPGDVFFVPPEVDVSIRREPGEYVSMQVPAPVLAAELAARRPSMRGGGHARVERLPVDASAAAELQAELLEYSRRVPSGSELCAQDPAAPIVGWIADALLRAGTVRSVLPLRVARARRIEEWIEAHLDEPITLGRLCAAAGVGGRCLQKTFEARHGTSPLEYVMQRRLARVRDRLLGAAPGTQVTSIAMDTGIMHMGRFAVRYRHAYGESPSATLRRRS